MRKINYIILLVICSIGMEAHSIEEGASDSLLVLKIKNEKLRPILDSMISGEKKCKYYNSKLLFDIKVQPTIKEYLNIQVEAIGFKPSSRMYVGCFEYGGHLFLVSGKLDDSLFIKTNKKKSIKAKSKNKSNQIIIEDDSFSTCLYKYHNNTFTLVGCSSYCK